jgi:putative FmdB family regulatory protein
MPVYEYQCQACSREFEYQQRMTDPDKTTCEVCGGALDRLISRTAFTLKGGGWYKDLYASPKPEAGGKANGAAEGKSDGKAGETSAGKAESPAASTDKPAAKPSSSSNSSGGGGSSGASGSSGSSGAASSSASGTIAKAS